MTYTYVHIINHDGRNLIQRVEDEAWIPSDPNNCDYQAYLKCIASGYTPKTIDYRIAEKAKEKEN